MPVARLASSSSLPTMVRSARKASVGCAMLLSGLMLAHSASAAEQLLLTATGKDGSFLGNPSCLVSFQVTNGTSAELTQFSTDLRAVDAASGKALSPVSLPGVGIAGDRLAPQAVSKPWPLNLKDTQCASVAVRFSKLRCMVGGKKCPAIAVEQKGMASITAPEQ